MKTRYTLILILVIALCASAVSMVLAQQPPPLPHAFYGALKDVNGKPAPVGTVVVAIVNGAESGRIRTFEEGKYGSEEPGKPKLIVQGYVANGSEITFFANGIQTNETAYFISGEVTQLNLSIATQWASEEVPPTNVIVNATVSTTTGVVTTILPPPQDQPPETRVNVSIDLTTNVDISNQTVTVIEYTIPPVGTQDPSTFGLLGVGRYISIESTITAAEISKVIIRIYYTDGEIAATGINENLLRLYWWNPATSAWEVVTPGGVDTVENYVWGETTHFSVFALLATVPVISPTPAPAGAGGGGGAGALLMTPQPTATPVVAPRPTPTPVTPAPTPTITPAPPPAPSPAPPFPVVPLVAVIAIVVVVILVAVAYVVLRRKKA